MRPCSLRAGRRPGRRTPSASRRDGRSSCESPTITAAVPRASVAIASAAGSRDACRLTHHAQFLTEASGCRATALASSRGTARAAATPSASARTARATSGCRDRRVDHRARHPCERVELHRDLGIDACRAGPRRHAIGELARSPGCARARASRDRDPRTPRRARDARRRGRSRPRPSRRLGSTHASSVARSHARRAPSARRGHRARSRRSPGRRRRRSRRGARVERVQLARASRPRARSVVDLLARAPRGDRRLRGPRPARRGDAASPPTTSAMRGFPTAQPPPRARRRRRRSSTCRGASPLAGDAATCATSARHAACRAPRRR